MSDPYDPRRAEGPGAPRPLNYRPPERRPRRSVGWVVIVVVLSLLAAAALLFGACALALR